MTQNISGSGIEKNSPNSYLAYADNGTLSTNNANVNSSTFQDKKYDEETVFYKSKSWIFSCVGNNFFMCFSQFAIFSVKKNFI